MPHTRATQSTQIPRVELAYQAIKLNFHDYMSILAPNVREELLMLSVESLESGYMAANRLNRAMRRS